MVPSSLKVTSCVERTWLLTLKASTKLAVETSKPVVKVYSFISSPVLPDTNILVPSLLKARPIGLVSWDATLKASTKLAVDTSKPVVKVYSFTSLPAAPITNILVPSLLKVTPCGEDSWVATLKASTKVVPLPSDTV